MAESTNEKSEKNTKRNSSNESRPAKRSFDPAQYFRETRGELRKVTWPTREEAFRLTLVVLGVMAVMALFLAAFDLTFSSGRDLIIDMLT